MRALSDALRVGAAIAIIQTVVFLVLRRIFRRWHG